MSSVLYQQNWNFPAKNTQEQTTFAKFIELKRVQHGKQAAETRCNWKRLTPFFASRANCLKVKMMLLLLLLRNRSNINMHTTSNATDWKRRHFHFRSNINEPSTRKSNLSDKYYSLYGGCRRGAQGTHAPFQSNCFHFHAVFSNIMPNNRLPFPSGKS